MVNAIVHSTCGAYLSPAAPIQTCVMRRYTCAGFGLGPTRPCKWLQVQPMLTADNQGLFRADNHGWFFGWTNGMLFQARSRADRSLVASMPAHSQLFS